VAAEAEPLRDKRYLECLFQIALARENMSKKIEIVVNPFSRGQMGRVASWIVKRIAKQTGNGCWKFNETKPFGFQAEIDGSSHDGDIVIFIGGDSTARLMAQTSLAYNDRPTLFTVVPLGLGNDFSRQFYPPLTFWNIFWRLPRLLRKIVKSDLREVRLDTMELNGTITFLSTFAFGLDADVACFYHRFRKTAFGRWVLHVPLVPEIFYFLAAVFFMCRRRSFDGYHILYKRMDTEQLEEIPINKGAFTVQVTNSMFYGGARVYVDGSINDGLFEITVIRNFAHLAVLFATKIVPAATAISRKILDQRRTDEVRIELPACGCNFHIDGERATDILSKERTLVFRMGKKFRFAVPG
jgi:diacylglycerol kinase family enzyme